MLEWLNRNTTLVFDVISTRGILINSFKELATTYNWSPIVAVPQHINIGRKKLIQIANLFRNLSNCWNIQRLSNYSIIYANTITTLKLAIKIKKKKKNKPKIILHIHELKTVIDLYLPDSTAHFSQVDQFIVPSNLVKDTLLHSWNIPSDKIELVREFSTIKISTKNISEDKAYFHVGGSGLVHWRKGPHLFIQVAHKIVKAHPKKKIKFTWVGKISRADKIIIANDLEKAGLTDVVEFVGESVHPLDHFQHFDLFLLTSREDPFPLVCIEVGMLGIPIICFENATGTEEILKNGGGFIVPYLDIAAMAKKVIFYYDHPTIRQKDGNLNKKQFAQFTPENQCPKIYDIIRQV